MGKKNIYEKNIGYSILKPVVDFNLKHSYRKVEVRGMENIPTDGPVIIAPNHCNTLMDALVILRSRKEATVFGARADMFNSPLIAKIMYFIKILPMVRQRDGLRNVLKNVETQEVIVDTLEHDVAFCVFPEGRHRAAKSLLPIGKGIFRAALAANERFGERKPIYIVPAGIEYGDFFRYRSTSLVTFGKPLNVTEFIKGLDVESEAQMMEPLRKELTSRISELFTYIKDDEYLHEKWILTKMISIASGKKAYGDFGTCLYDSMLENRKIVASVEKAIEEKPEEMKELLEEVKEFNRYRLKDKVSIYSFSRRNTLARRIGKGFAALIGLPYYIFSSAASLPMWVTELILRRNIKDKAFRNTASFGIKLGLGIIWFIIWTVLTFSLTPWPVAAALTLLELPAYSYFHDYNEGMRRFISDLRIRRCKKLRKRFATIVTDFKKL